MSRLVDDVCAKKAITDYLMKCVDDNKFSVDVTEVQIGIINIINGLPTAYDVENVVTEIEELANYNGNAYLDSADVLEIVKRGGEK